ncbi:hypothetical protein D3C72_2142790 [compost metagenome]
MGLRAGVRRAERRMAAAGQSACYHGNGKPATACNKNVRVVLHLLLAYKFLGTPRYYPAIVHIFSVLQGYRGSYHRGWR